MHLSLTVLVPAGHVATQVFVSVLNLCPEVVQTQESLDEVTVEPLGQTSHVCGSFKYASEPGHGTHAFVSVLNLFTPEQRQYVFEKSVAPVAPSISEHAVH